MTLSLPALSLVAFLALCLPVAGGQTSHRGPDPRVRSTPDVFETMDKQRQGERRPEPAKADAARQQRQVQATEVAKDLHRLSTLTQALQERLKSTDLQNSLPADLRKQSGELERLAHNINKKVRGL